MLPHLLEKSAGISRDKLFWATISVLLVGQLVAFWMLCSDQVRRAEARNATLHVERMAVADCLRYIPDATAHSCAVRVASQGHDTGAARAAANSAVARSSAMSSTIPVSFTVR